MSAQERKEELARLADATKAAKAEGKTAKAQVAEGKAAVKAAKTVEEKASLKESLAALEAAYQAATASVAEAVAREEHFRAEAKVIEDAENVQQGRFARTRGSHDRHQFAFSDFEVDALQHVKRRTVVIGFVDVFQFDHNPSASGEGCRVTVRYACGGKYRD